MESGEQPPLPAHSAPGTPSAPELHVIVTPPTPPQPPRAAPPRSSQVPGSMAGPSEEPTSVALRRQSYPHRNSSTSDVVQQLVTANPELAVTVAGDGVYGASPLAPAPRGGEPALRLSGQLAPSERLAGQAATSAAAASTALSLADVQAALATDSRRLILILFGDAYDITPMRDAHPGGLRVLINHNGRECGDVFMRIHGLRARKMVQQYYVGAVEGLTKKASPLRPPDAAAAAGAGGAQPRAPQGPKAQSTRVLEKELVNASGTLQYFTFACPKPLQMHPGGHVKLFSNVQRDEGRFYSPCKTDVASFTICVKLYPNGRTSRFLFGRGEGEEVFFDGPMAPSWLLCKDAAVQATPPPQRHVLLLAGGTGVAPLYSIAANALESQSASVTLVCSVHTADDLPLITELRRLVARYSKSLPDQPHTFRVAVILPRTEVDERGAATASLAFAAPVLCGGRLTAALLAGMRIAPAQAAVLCGPPEFNDAVAAAVVKSGVCAESWVHRL